MQKGAIGIADPAPALNGTSAEPAIARSSDLRLEDVQNLRPLLRRYFARRVPGDAVEDMVHDVFLALLRRGSAPIRLLRSYAIVTAANLFNARIRENKRAAANRLAPPGWGIPAPLDAPDQSYIERSMIDAVRDTLSRLPVRTRQIFMLSRFSELSYPDIAGHLGISTSSVEKHMMRALAALRDVAAEHL